MKKILIIHSSLGGGGAERVLIDILRNFDYTQYDVSLLLVCGSGVYLELLPSKVNYIGSIYRNKRGLFKRIIAELRLNKLFEPIEINKIVKDYYDVIISFMESYPARYHSYILNRAKKNISWVHTDLLTNHWSEKRFLSKTEESSFYSKMDSVAFVSQRALDSFVTLFNYKKKNLLVIYNPIDKARIKMLANENIINKTGLVFVAVGRMVYQKRYDRLLKAAQILKSRGCLFNLLILGTGILEKELKELSIKLGVNDVVSFLGFINNPYPYIRIADALVLSSDTEGFPTVVCEAMTLGIPVIGTNVTGIRDLLGSSEYGLITDPNAESFADAMFSLLSDSQLRSYYSDKSLERAKELGIDNSMKHIYSVIN